MSQFEGEVLDYLVEDIMEGLDRDEYDPDEFYEEAVLHLSVYGYDLCHEVIWELNEHEASDIEEDHTEVIAEIGREEDSSYLRFILEDGRPDEQAPKLERVRGPEDFDYGV